MQLRANGSSRPRSISFIVTASTRSAAATNKMTLYRHFDSKDELVAECLRRLAAETDALWEENARAHAGDPRGQLLGWVRDLGAWKLDLAERGCGFLNAAAELPDKRHPARRVVEEFKS